MGSWHVGETSNISPMHRIFMPIWILVIFAHFVWLPMEICGYLFDLALILTLLDGIKSKYYLIEQNLLELREIIYSSMCGHLQILSFQQKSNGEYDAQITNLKLKADEFFLRIHQNASQLNSINQNKTNILWYSGWIGTNRIVKYWYLSIKC
eukprot:UN13734